MYSTVFLLLSVSYTACHKNVHPLIRFEENYNSKVMPLKFLPLNVNLTIHITNVYEIDNVYQLLGLETTVQMNWIDERIELLDIPVEHPTSDRITLPPEVQKICVECNNPVFIVSITYYILDLISRKQQNFGFQIYLSTVRKILSLPLTIKNHHTLGFTKVRKFATLAASIST